MQMPLINYILMILGRCHHYLHFIVRILSLKKKNLPYTVIIWLFYSVYFLLVIVRISSVF